MKTRDMIAMLNDESYPLSLIATQSGVSYMKLFRYCRRDGKLSPDEKAKLWRFAIVQPIIADAITAELDDE